MARKKSPQTPSSGEIRIIGGKYRGRKLSVPNHDGLRPTGNRIRETLFNWLAMDIPDAVCIDCCSGSGALAFEAASRGAKQVWAMDTFAPAIAALQTSKQAFRCDNITITQQCATNWLNHYDGSIDIAFVDPPFANELIQTLLNTISSHKGCHEQTVIYVEAASNRVLSLPTNWSWSRHKSTGDVQYGLLTQQ